jgi:hypothetical protein
MKTAAGKPERFRNRAAVTENFHEMKHSSAYLKMRVLGAIDMAPGKTIQARLQAVSQMTFTDEEGHPRQFFYKAERMGEARRLDPVANDRKPVTPHSELSTAHPI